MIRTIQAIYDRIWPAPALSWAQEWPGTISAGKYTIIADRHTYWENDLYLSGNYVTNATTVERLMQIAANHKRRNG